MHLLLTFLLFWNYSTRLSSEMTMNFEKALTINSRGYAFYANYYNIGFVIILE